LLRKVLNSFGKSREPIFFLIDFKKSSYFIQRLKDLDNDIFYFLDGVTNKSFNLSEIDIKMESEFINFSSYSNKFHQVISEIEQGNTYMLNLTAKTEIKLNKSLQELYSVANSKFKLYFKDKFISFSPERFIEIKDNKIYTYPMKGTISSKISNAKELILNDKKELAEHIMVVDLLRNDLGIVARDIKVEKFRYVDEVRVKNDLIYQVSSKISGSLGDDWQSRLGDIIYKTLPAGSISGTPKKKSVEIIERVEGYDRRFFCGIFGIFDGNNLDSAVLIRFIEKDCDKFFYKSGGGITIDSDVLKEYEELKSKVYLPIVMS